MAATVVAIVGCEKTQDLGPAEVTVVSPAETTVNAPQEGTEFTVTLKATIDWALSGYTEEVSSWLSVSPVSGSASAEPQTITVKVLANDGADRKADLVFYGNVLCKAALTVSQKGNGAAGGGSTDPDAIYHADFTASINGFTIEDKDKPSAVEAIWAQTSEYGMVASAYVDGTDYSSESWLVSPVIDLSAEAKAFLTFEHAVNFFKDVETAKSETSVYARVENGEWKRLEGFIYPSKLSWTFVSAGYVDLSAYVGKKMQVAFVYKSTADKAGTWEVKNMSITKESVDVSDPELPAGAIVWEIDKDVQNWAEATDDTYGKGYSATVDGITVGFYKHNSSTDLLAPSSDQFRIYKNAAFKISSEKTLSKVILYATESGKCVDLTSLEGDSNGFTADKTALTVTWTGSSKNIVAAATNGQVRVNKIVFICE